MTAPDIYAPVRQAPPEWLEQPSAADLRDREAWAKANRARINAEWNAEWDGRIEPLTPAEKRQADAEWRAM